MAVDDSNSEGPAAPLIAVRTGLGHLLGSQLMNALRERVRSLAVAGVENLDDAIGRHGCRFVLPDTYDCPTCLRE